MYFFRICTLGPLVFRIDGNRVSWLLLVNIIRIWVRWVIADTQQIYMCFPWISFQKIHTHNSYLGESVLKQPLIFILSIYLSQCLVAVFRSFVVTCWNMGGALRTTSQGIVWLISCAAICQTVKLGTWGSHLLCFSRNSFFFFYCFFYGIGEVVKIVASGWFSSFGCFCFVHLFKVASIIHIV